MVFTQGLRALAGAFVVAAGTLLGGAVLAPAEAATLGFKDYSGNDCSGVFGQGFEDCKDPTGSPIVAKYDEDKGAWSINPMFPGVLSSYFTLTYDDDEGKSGTWTYDPGACSTCPVITSFVVKASNAFRWYFTDPKQAIFSGTWSTAGLNGTRPAPGLSHISFYDTAPVPVPVPAAGLLLVAALGGLGMAARRRKA